MNTFLKKISCGSDCVIEFSAAVKSEFNIPAEAYISFSVSERGPGKKVVFEKGQLAGSPDEDWSLRITTSDLDCGSPHQIFENNNIYDYRIAVYPEEKDTVQAFYLQCYLLTKDIFSFDSGSYKAVVLSYVPGCYKEEPTDIGMPSVYIPFWNSNEDLQIDSKYLNPANTAIFGFDYVLGQHGGQDNLVFKSGVYELRYDSESGLWEVPKEQLQGGIWEYAAQIEPVSWSFSTKFGWIDGDFLNAETGVAMHSYRRGFSYADESSASGWMFGSEQSSNFNYEAGLIADTSDGLTGGPTQKLSVIQNAIQTTVDPNWEVFKSNYYSRYNVRGFQLNGVERTIGSSVYSLNTVDAPVVELDSDLNLFIQNVELESSSGLSNRIENDDLLTWTAVLDAQSRSVNVDWTIPSGYTAHWCYVGEEVGAVTPHLVSPSDYSSFDFDLDVPISVGVEEDFYNSSWMMYDSSNHSWYVDNPELTPLAYEGWTWPNVLVEDSSTYWTLAGFARGGMLRFIQAGDASGNIVDVAGEPNHYLWNFGQLLYEGSLDHGANVLLNNLDGTGAVYPLWGHAGVIEVTFSFGAEVSSSSSSHMGFVDLQLGFAAYTTGYDLAVVDLSEEVGEHRYRLIDTVAQFRYPLVSGDKIIKIILPSFVNAKQAFENGWELGFRSNDPDMLGRVVSAFALGYSIQGGIEDIEVESMVCEDESIAFRDFDVRRLKTLTTAQSLAWSLSSDYFLQELETLTFLNPDVEFQPTALKLGRSVDHQPPFAAWSAMSAQTGRGTKIVVNLGADDLMSRQGFPFGALEKSYFECRDLNDSGYVIYNGTQWIKWLAPTV